ncbi:FHA domain-containing protein [Polyangium aurulentum]|uniref:FHA domain-containing protein n=1 Tax=Polyangium aurulentum TaxID=2567896 RepID=UPI0010ADEA60|nr:FHA domain-containing protein [Polyangium aurulentum]UQA61660.1 FHA domain-containing protein [Polyangium aurulentum]
MPFRIRYLAHDLELPVGEFIVGRGPECQLAVDDPLVSRKHAALHVRKDGVVAQDLGSRNGVLVNGLKIDGPRELSPGDKIRIGNQEIIIYKTDEPRSSPLSDEEHRRAMQTIGGMNVNEIHASIEAAALDSVGDGRMNRSETSRRFQSVRLLCGVADKALAMGKPDEAERILNALLQGILKRSKIGQRPKDGVAEYAALYAARLAAATTKGLWVDYVFDLYGSLHKVLPATVIDELYTVVRKAKSIDVKLFRGYVEDLRKIAPQLGPADRFLLQRIEGLDRLLGGS